MILWPLQQQPPPLFQEPEMCNIIITATKINYVSITSLGIMRISVYHLAAGKEQENVKAIFIRILPLKKLVRLEDLLDP